jgi:uracil-DNA glycosylase
MTTRSVTGLLRLLKNSPHGAVFNPWWQVDPDNDIGPTAPRIRREQLRAYLSERIGKARLALIGEALGYRGGHFSGIAMTSERMLLEQWPVLAGLAPRRTSQAQKSPRGFSEPTASIVWAALLELSVPADGFVLWNVFPWHSFHPRTGLLSNRTPTPAELLAGVPALEAFVDLFPCECVVAVGRLAEAQLASLAVKIERVRHPASGGAALFRRQIAAIVRAL